MSILVHIIMQIVIKLSLYNLGQKFEVGDRPSWSVVSFVLLFKKKENISESKEELTIIGIEY